MRNTRKSRPGSGQCPPCDKGHSCIVAFVHSADAPLVESAYDVDTVTRNNRQVAQDVNAWIRHHNVGENFDAVLDLESTVVDPSFYPNKDLANWRLNATVNPSLDSGDHVHPSAAGYQAMAGRVANSMSTCVSRMRRSPATLATFSRASWGWRMW